MGVLSVEVLYKRSWGLREMGEGRGKERGQEMGWRVRMRLGRHGLGAFLRRMRSAVEERSGVMVMMDDRKLDTRQKKYSSALQNSKSFAAGMIKHK